MTRDQYIAQNKSKPGYQDPRANIINVPSPIIPQVAATPPAPPTIDYQSKLDASLTKMGIDGTRASQLIQNPIFKRNLFEMSLTPEERQGITEYQSLVAKDKQRENFGGELDQMKKNSTGALRALENALREKNDIGNQPLGESEYFKAAGLDDIYNLQRSLGANLNTMKNRYGSFTNVLSRVSQDMADQYIGLSSSYKTLSDEYQTQYAQLNSTLDKIAQHEEAMSLAEKEAQLQQDTLAFKDKLDSNANKFQPVQDLLVPGQMWSFNKVTGQYTLSKLDANGNLSQGIPGGTSVTPTGNVTSFIFNGKNITADQSVQKALQQADVAMFAATGQHIDVNSSNRTYAEQKAIRDKFGYTSDTQPSGYNGLPPAAPPGQSLHESGLALDVTNWEAAKPFLNAAGIQGGGMIPGDAGHFSMGAEFGGNVAQAPSILGQANIVATTGNQGVIPAAPKPLTEIDIRKLSQKAGYDIKKTEQTVQQWKTSGGAIPDELMQIRQYGKILNTAEKTSIDALSSINNKIKILEDNLNLVPAGEAGNLQEAMATAANGKWMELQARLFKFPPDVANYLSTRDGMSATFARAGGEKGALSEGDINRAVALLPEITDSQELRTKKLETLKKVMNAINKDYTNSDTNALAEVQSILGTPLESGTKVEYKGGGRPEAIQILNSQGYPVTEENINAIINSK